MKRHLCLLLFIGCIHLALAQSAFLDFGNTQSLRINSNGTLGIDIIDLSPHSYLDGDDNKPYIGQAGLWIVAQDEDGTWHSSVQFMQGIDSLDYWPGPVDTFSGLPADITTWDRVWSTTQDEIDYHLANYTKDGYTPSDNLANWPANGYNDFNQYLAPFIDMNEDRLYNPKDGDYPLIKGDRAAYCIFNDLALEHKASFGIELGIEVLLMAYQYDESPTIFLEYFIINRSINTYTNLFCGFFLNGACGNPNDNYAATINNGIISTAVFQGDDMDEGYFGTTYPYVQATFPTQGIDKTIAFNNGQGIDGNPIINSEFIELGSGNWKNGETLTAGGTGVGGSVPTDYIFQNPTWNEDPDNDNGNRTILAIDTYQNWEPKDFIRFRAALDIGKTVSKEDLFSTLFSQQKMTESLFSSKTVKVDKPTKDQKLISVYPNPSNHIINIKSESEILEAYISDNQGKKVWISESEKKMHLECNEKLSPGIYTLKLKTREGTQVTKLCVTN